MARTEPGRDPGRAAGRPTRAVRRLRRHRPRPRRDPRPRADALAAPELLRLLPLKRAAIERPRRLSEHGPRRARPVVAGLPGADGARGGRRRLDAADGRPARRLPRRDPGHGLDQHAARADLRRASGRRLTAWPGAACRRKRGRSSSTRRARRTAPSRRPRCSPGSGARTSARSPSIAAYAMRPEALDDAIRRDLAEGKTALRRGRNDRDHRVYRHRPDRRDRRRRPARAASGSTSTPRWRARP